MSEPTRTESILRVQKRERWTVLENEVVRDKRLSFAARGLLAYLLSRPDNWQCSVPDLINQSPAGETHVRSCLKELKNFGYVKRLKFRRKDGTTYWETFVYESPQVAVEADEQKQPQVENPQVENPHGENPQVDDPQVGEPHVENRQTKKYRGKEVPKEEVPSGRKTEAAEYSGRQFQRNGRATPPPPQASGLPVSNPVEVTLCQISGINPTRPSSRDVELWPEAVALIQSQSAQAQLTPEELAGALVSFRDWWFGTPTASGGKRQSLYLSNVVAHFPRFMQRHAQSQNKNEVSEYDYDPAAAGRALRAAAYGRK